MIIILIETINIIIKESNVKNKQLLLEFVDMYPKQALKLYEEEGIGRGDFLRRMGSAALAGFAGLGANKARGSESSSQASRSFSFEDKDVDVTQRPSNATRNDFTPEEIKKYQTDIIVVRKFLSNKNLLTTQNVAQFFQEYVNHVKEIIYYSKSSKSEAIQLLQDEKEAIFGLGKNEAANNNVEASTKALQNDPSIILQYVNEIDQFLFNNQQPKLQEKIRAIRDFVDSKR